MKNLALLTLTKQLSILRFRELHVKGALYLLIWLLFLWKFSFYFIKNYEFVDYCKICDHCFLYSANSEDTNFFSAKKQSNLDLVEIFSPFSSSFCLTTCLTKCEVAGIGLLNLVKIVVFSMKSVDTWKILSVHYYIEKNF